MNDNALHEVLAFYCCVLLYPPYGLYISVSLFVPCDNGLYLNELNPLIMKTIDQHDHFHRLLKILTY